MAGKKDKAWKACSKYIRLRDSIEWSRANNFDITGTQPKLLLCKCVTCNTIKSWPRLDAGHFIPRGSRGQSGVYFDERNIHAQCGSCNAYQQGNTLVYLEFMQAKYGQPVVDELRALDLMVKSYSAYELMKYEILYKQLYGELLKEF